jgi:Type II secretion system (T2SS), protein E, N-terminal domain
VPARLGQLLLGEGLIKPAQLEEALEAQVIHGGRIGTNLVELGFLKEADLARTLGKQHNMTFASGEMQPDPNALSVADADFLDDKDVMPMRMNATQIMVAVMSPMQLEAIDAIGFKAGRKVAPVVIPEFRMNQLLRKYARAFRPMRPIDMNTLRERRKDLEPKPGDPGDLIDEGDFAKLYAHALEGLGGEEEEPLLVGEVIEDAPAVPAAPPGVVIRPGAPPPAPSVPQPRMSAPKPPAEKPRPLNFAEAQAMLQQSQNREDIARILLRFAISKFRRALLLSVRGDLLTGWHGLGIRVTERAVQRIGLSLGEDNTFQLVRNTRSHYIGPMKVSPGTEVFYKLLGGKFPQTVVMMPLLVSGKPVHILYVDHGPKTVTPPDVGELLILSQAVTRSYDALIKARKS